MRYIGLSHCGAIGFALAGEPTDMVRWHCRDCRRSTELGWMKSAHERPHSERFPGWR